MSALYRLIGYAQRYWKRLALSGVATMCFGILSALPAYLVRTIIDTIIGPRQTALLIPFMSLLVALFILKGMFMYLSNYYMEHVGNSVVRDVRRDLFGSLLAFPTALFKQKTSGDLLTYFISDIRAVQDACSRSIRMGVRSLVEAIFLLGVAISQNWTLALVIVVVGPIIGIIMRMMGKKMRATAAEGQKNIGILASYLQQVIIGIRDISACNAQEAEKKRFENALRNYFEIVMRNVRVVSLAPAIIECCAMFGTTVVLYIALNQVLDGTITGGQLGSFFAATMLAYQPLKRLINVYADIQVGLAAATRIFTLMDTAHPHAHHYTIALAHVRNAIHINHLSFAYEQEQPLLQNISCTIHIGERIGIMGASGSGKSTFGDLLLGFMHPTQGTISLDGIDITTLTRESLRAHFGYVGQRTFLFNDTIAANIAYGYPQASDEDIITAAQKAHAHDFIMSLPKQYETVVGEDGALLSGGQKQRLTIARALIKKPAILLLDEATSALDQATATEITRTLQELPRTMTIIAISHHVSALQGMDRIMMLKEGSLIDHGRANPYPSNIVPITMHNAPKAE